jgi:hypothetical protein
MHPANAITTNRRSRIMARLNYLGRMIRREETLRIDHHIVTAGTAWISRATVAITGKTLTLAVTVPALLLGGGFPRWW